MAAGTVVFVPAALLRSYGIFLTGLFVQGTGLCLLQTAANPYVIILGPHESAARRVSIMSVCNKLAGAISPMLLGALVFAGFGHIQASGEGPIGAAALDALAHRLLAPYIAMAAGLLVLAIGIERCRLPEPTDGTSQTRCCGWRCARRARPARSLR